MRKASIRQNHRDFETILDVLDRLAKQVVLRQIGADLDESDLLAEGLVLTLAGHWEQVVDEDFVDALNRDTSAYAERVGVDLPKNLSRGICFGLLVGDGYLDFRSTGDILSKSKKLLVPANNPFNHLTKTVRKNIDQFYIFFATISHIGVSEHIEPIAPCWKRISDTRGRFGQGFFFEPRAIPQVSRALSSFCTGSERPLRRYGGTLLFETGIPLQSYRSTLVRRVPEETGRFGVPPLELDETGSHAHHKG